MFKKLFLAILLLLTTHNTGFAANQNDNLLNAAVNGSVHLAEKALANGADVNYAPPYRLSPLTIATKNKKYELVRLLLDKGADPNLAVNNGFSTDTPLLYSIYNNDSKIAELLLLNGADPNQGRLVHKQLHIDIPLRNPNTHHSNKKSYDINYQLTVTPQMRSYGATPLIYAIQKDGTDNPSLEMVNLLLNNGAIPNKANDYGYTPLMATADLQLVSRKFIRLDIAKLLLDKGANPKHEDNYGNTALNFASSTRFKEIADVLLPYLN